jgi:predicted phosphodiesterase
MHCQLLSDLHTEFSPFQINKNPNADALILAGDIGNPFTTDYDDVVKSAAALFKYVFIIRGNHECYGSTLESTDIQIEAVCAPYANVYFLNRTCTDIPGIDVCIAGTTLWSDIDPFFADEVRMSLSDFRAIRDWSVQQHVQEHTKDVEFIKSAVQYCVDTGKKLVVVTHHAPSPRGTQPSAFEGDETSSGFVTDLEDMIAPPIRAWVYGHTHHSYSQIINGVYVASNQRGYDNEHTGFNPTFMFSV